MHKQKPLVRSIILGIVILIGMIIYGYGFNVTKVNFETTRSEKRLTQLSRIMRALAHPSIFVYEKEENKADVPIYLPCPKDSLPDYSPNKSGPYLVLTPKCAGPGETIYIEGYNLWPNTKGPINFVAFSGVNLTIGHLHTDANGYFNAKVQLPKRKPVDEAQMIRAISRRNIGNPRFSDVAISTWEKIIETVFLALLATTFGTMLAIPISFLAARNLMSDQKASLTNISFSIISWPFGIIVGIRLSSLVDNILKKYFADNNLVWNILGSVIGLTIIWFTIKTLFVSPTKDTNKNKTKYFHTISIILIALTSICTILICANLAITVGQSLIEPLGPIGFMGNFMSQLGDVINMIMPISVGLVTGGALSFVCGKISYHISNKMSPIMISITHTSSAIVAGTVIGAIIGNTIEWFYQLDNQIYTLIWPMIIGAIIGLIISVRTSPKYNMPIGYVSYYIVRTLLNATRSIEPLVMVIVFVVWVGIGPFAGSLALALHTIAALAKLYSEQVESIAPGPLEAVRATGANRLQTIVYAVIPQIIPPYISFTMYRWDINVRMSTIIGFAGGGGIGFLLQQNINLLDYRAASVQMLAIAIVVATMDYISAVIREKFV